MSDVEISIREGAHMMKSLTRNSYLGALIAVAVSAGVLTVPAKAAEQVTLTIWTFGEVIQPGLQR